MKNNEKEKAAIKEILKSGDIELAYVVGKSRQIDVDILVIELYGNFLNYYVFIKYN
jgi:hypothetical protein